MFCCFISIRKKTEYGISKLSNEYSLPTLDYTILTIKSRSAYPIFLSFLSRSCFSGRGFSSIVAIAITKVFNIWLLLLLLSYFSTALQPSCRSLLLLLMNGNRQYRFLFPLPKTQRPCFLGACSVTFGYSLVRLFFCQENRRNNKRPI